jgi:hypothetical protein
MEVADGSSCGVVGLCLTRGGSFVHQFSHQSAAHHKTTEREKRGKGFNSNPELEVDSRSWAIINGDLELLPGTWQHTHTHTHDRLVPHTHGKNYVS